MKAPSRGSVRGADSPHSKPGKSEVIEVPYVSIGERLRREPRSRPHRYLVLFGMEPVETKVLVQRVEEGLTYSQLKQFQTNVALPMEQIADLVQIKLRTISRRKDQERLRPEESDRLVRAARVFGATLELFEGDAEAARRWFGSPQPALGGAVPQQMAQTDVGAREVESLIGRLEHGVFS